MKKLQGPSQFPGGIQKVTDIDRLVDEGQSVVIGKILATREVRELINHLLPQVLTTLAGESKVKGFVFKKVGDYIQKSLSRPDDVFEKSELSHLFEDEAFVKEVLEPMPDIADGIMAVLTGVVKTIGDLPVKEKKEVLSALLGERNNGRQGQMVGEVSRILKEIHQEDPEFLTHTLGPGLVRRLDGIDFGELKVLLDGTFTDLTSLMKVVNDALFNRPAKVVLLLAVLPSLVNMLTKVLEDTVARFNEFPPDLAADVILSLFREVDAKTVGVLANGAMEVFRKINVGSALIGDPGMPQCRLDMAAFIDAFTNEIDVELLWKFRELVAVSMERMNLSMLSVLKKKPELVIAQLRNAPKISNYAIRAKKQKMRLIEDLPEDESLAALREGLANFDTNAAAEIVNSAASILNRLTASDPNLLPDLADEFISSLDLYEVEDAVQSTLENIGDVIKPLGDIIIPNLIKMIAGWLSTNGNGHSDGLGQARDVIVQFLNHKEVAA